MWRRSLTARKARSTANTLGSRTSKVPGELRRPDCRVNDKRSVLLGQRFVLSRVQKINTTNFRSSSFATKCIFHLKFYNTKIPRFTVHAVLFKLFAMVGKELKDQGTSFSSSVKAFPLLIFYILCNSQKFPRRSHTKKQKYYAVIIEIVLSKALSTICQVYVFSGFCLSMARVEKCSIHGIKFFPRQLTRSNYTSETPVGIQSYTNNILNNMAGETMY